MYLLDANTYIQAKNLHYQMSFCPAYWSWLDQQHSLGKLGSIRTVYDELAQGDDELATWVKDRNDHFMPLTEEQVQEKFSEVAQYVADLPGKGPEHVSDFLSGADPWLIAAAATMSGTVVTHEVAVPDNSRKIRIPNICKAFEVSYVTTFELLNRLQAQFILNQ